MCWQHTVCCMVGRLACRSVRFWTPSGAGTACCCCNADKPQLLKLMIKSTGLLLTAFPAALQARMAARASTAATPAHDVLLLAMLVLVPKNYSLSVYDEGSPSTHLDLHGCCATGAHRTH